MPVAVLAAGAFFNVVNAFLNGYWLFFLAPPQAAAWLTSAAFVGGAVLFGGGFLAHVLADRELRQVRAATPGGYGMPRGLLFRLVSCPNYLGEIVEWSGFALATLSPGALLVRNLDRGQPRAASHPPPPLVPAKVPGLPALAARGSAVRALTEES